MNQRASSLTIECWDEKRTLVRRVAAVRLERPGRLELEVEHFGGRTGRAYAGRSGSRDASRCGPQGRAARNIASASGNRCIASFRTGAWWNSARNKTCTTVFLRPIRGRCCAAGRAALAAIGIAENSPSPANALTFGLIWLDYLRRREPRLTIESLALFAPAGQEHAPVSPRAVSGPACSALSDFRPRWRRL